MNELSSTASKPEKGWMARLVDGWQTIFALFSALFVLVPLSILDKLEAPGAPVALFAAMFAVSVLVPVAHWPSNFARFPKGWRGVPYVASLGSILLMGATVSAVDAAWEKTPQGAAQAAERKAVEAEAARAAKTEAEAEARRQRDGAALREAEALKEQVEEIADKLESCFSTFGHRLPALEKSVKDGLHNPDAFEHVETLAIVPDAGRNNVAMKFRAENGFGAIRLGVVKASVDPDSCEIVSIGNPEPM